MSRGKLIAANVAVWTAAVIVGAAFLLGTTADYCDLGGVSTPDGYEGGEERQANGRCVLRLYDQQGEPAPDSVYERMGHRAPGTFDPSSVVRIVPFGALVAGVLFSVVTLSKYESSHRRMQGSETGATRTSTTSL